MSSSQSTRGGVPISAGADSTACEGESSRIGSPLHFQWLGGIVKTIVVLNLIDALMTLWWVRTGFATEANPLLREIVNDHALAFVTGKLALVSLGTTLLWWRRNRPLAVIGIFAVFLAYYVILLFHVGFASLLVGQLL